jgi:hypothetical protein
MIPDMARFLKYLSVYDENVRKSPITATLTITEAQVSSNPLDAIVGDSPRTTRVFTDVPVLFSRTFDSHARTKYGLSDEVSGIIYTSPQILKEFLGVERIAAQSLTINLLGENYLCERVVYQGDIPLYGTYYYAEMRLKDIKKGG